MGSQLNLYMVWLPSGLRLNLGTAKPAATSPSVRTRKRHVGTVHPCSITPLKSFIGTVYSLMSVTYFLN